MECEPHIQYNIKFSSSYILKVFKKGKRPFNNIFYLIQYESYLNINIKCYLNVNVKIIKETVYFFI